MTRQDQLARTFVTLADTLVDDFDVIDFLQILAERCVDLVDVSAAGIMLIDNEGTLRHVACSDERMRLVELFELQVQEGPCYDAYEQRSAVLCRNPEDALVRWPRFAPNAIEHGFAAVAGVPMRLRDQAIGALNVFSLAPDVLEDDELQLIQALADVATIGLLQQRAIQDAATLTTQLQGALESRIVIEQAKGIIAEQAEISVDEAFTRLRDYTRAHNRLLSVTAHDIVAGLIRPDDLADRTAHP